MLGVYTELALNKSDAEDLAFEQQVCVKIVTSFNNHKNRKNREASIIRPIQDKIKTNNQIVSKTDKGNTTVIMKTE